MKDYRIKITIRNDRLLSAIEDQGFPSVAQFCAANCLDYQRITEIIRGKLKPLNQKGAPIPLVRNLLDTLPKKSTDNNIVLKPDIRVLQKAHPKYWDEKEKDVLNGSDYIAVKL